MLRRRPGLHPGLMSARQRWTALVVLSVSLLIVMMDMTILIMALPELIADLAPSATQQLWIVDIYSLFLAGLLIPMSALADRWGRRRILLTGFAIFGLVSLLVLAARTAEDVIALRGLLGIGGAMIMPTTLSMIRTIFDDAKERATALAIWSVISGLGAIIGPVVGGGLLEVFDWRAAFLINVPFVAVTLVGGILLLPEARDPDPPRWDSFGAVLAMAGMSTLVWGIKRFADEGWGNLVAWAAVSGALALLIWFVRRCVTRDDPLLDVTLFRSRPFVAGTTSALASMFAMAALLLLVAQWLQAVEGHSPVRAGIMLLPMALGAILFAPAAPTLAIRFGARIVLTAGLAAAGAGLIVVILADRPLSYPQIVVPLSLVGAGIGSLAIASAIIMGSTPVAKAGNAAAIEETMYDLGNVLGIAVLGSVAAALYRSHLAVERFADEGVVAGFAEHARESVVEALQVADALDSPELALAATSAFTDALMETALVGGLIMLATAVMVFWLVPRGFDIAENGAGEVPAP